MKRLLACCYRNILHYLCWFQVNEELPSWHILLLADCNIARAKEIPIGWQHNNKIPLSSSIRNMEPSTVLLGRSKEMWSSCNYVLTIPLCLSTRLPWRHHVCYYSFSLYWFCLASIAILLGDHPKIGIVDRFSFWSLLKRNFGFLLLREH